MLRTSSRRSLAPGARLVLELRVQELGHEVVRGMLGAPVDVLAEQLCLVSELPCDSALLAVLYAESLVELVADGLLVRLGDAEEVTDRPHRHLRAEIRDEVEAA